jgi:hypothetical protein
MSESRNLHTYAIRRTGVAAVVDGPGGRELRFSAVISRKDGWSRPQTIVVRPTEARPGLIEAVSDAIRAGTPVRMVVRFERVTNEGDDGVTFMRVNAVVDTLLDGYRAPDPRQMDLFA